MSAGLLLVVLLLPDIATPVSGPSVITASHGRIAALLDPHRPIRRELNVDPTVWVALRAEGVVAVGPPPADKPALGAGTLEAGESRDGWLAFDVPSAADTLLLAYRFFGTTLFTVQLY